MKARRAAGAALNPFVTASAVSPASSSGPDEPTGEVAILGPSQPVMAPPVTNPVMWHTPVPTTLSALWVAGCHGGAGATSLAAALGHIGHESMRSWPVPEEAGYKPPVLLVARTTFSGLADARVAAQEWAANEVPWVRLVGLVLVADGPTLHPEVRGHIDQVLRLTPRGWFLPWQESWRALPVTDRPVDRAALQVLRSIISAAHNLST